METVQFGESESRARGAGRGAFGRKFAFTAPRFGRGCVCCNADPMGRTQQYDPSTDRIQADPIPMPVCFDCRGHALQTQFVPIMQACMLVVGISLGGLGIHYVSERPHDPMPAGMLAVGAVLLVGAIVWMVATHRRVKRERARGHHPGLMFVVGPGRTLLSSTNQTLVDELIALNPRARRQPSRRFGRKRIPEARVVRSAATVDEDGDLTEAEKARMLAEILGPRPQQVPPPRPRVADDEATDDKPRSR